MPRVEGLVVPYAEYLRPTAALIEDIYRSIPRYVTPQYLNSILQSESWITLSALLSHSVVTNSAGLRPGGRLLTPAEVSMVSRVRSIMDKTAQVMTTIPLLSKRWDLVRSARRAIYPYKTHFENAARVEAKNIAAASMHGVAGYMYGIDAEIPVESAICPCRSGIAVVAGFGVGFLLSRLLTR